MQFSRSKLKEKLEETLKAVFPILAIVIVLCFTIAPIEPGILMTFLVGAEECCFFLSGWNYP